MLEQKTIDTEQFKTREDFDRELTSLSKEGWMVGTSFGKRCQNLVLRRNIKIEEPEEEEEEEDEEEEDEDSEDDDEEEDEDDEEEEEEPEDVKPVIKKKKSKKKLKKKSKRIDYS